MILALSALRANKQLNVCYSGISTSLSRLWSSTTRHLSAIATLLLGRFNRAPSHHWRPLKWSTRIWHFNWRNEAFVHFNRNQCKPRHIMNLQSNLKLRFPQLASAASTSKKSVDWPMTKRATSFTSCHGSRFKNSTESLKKCQIDLINKRVCPFQDCVMNGAEHSVFVYTGFLFAYSCSLK